MTACLVIGRCGLNLPLIRVELCTAVIPRQTDKLNDPAPGFIGIVDHLLILDVENGQWKHIVPVGHQLFVLYVEFAQPTQVCAERMLFFEVHKVATQCGVHR